MIISIIDIGSNTIKLNVVLCRGDERQLLLVQSKRGALAQCKDGGVLSEEGELRLREILRRYRLLALEQGSERIFVFATESLRGITNADSICEGIKKELSLDIEILTGEQEAQLSFDALCARRELSGKSGITADMGGGSTELTLFTDGRAEGAFSLPLGSLRVKRLTGASTVPDSAARADITEHTKTVLSGYMPGVSREDLYVIGGTARALFGLSGSGETELTVCRARELYRQTASRADAESFLHRELPERADSVLTGILVLLTVAEHFGATRMILCKCGVREGYLEKKIKDEKILI